jgi:hypothetical protein
MVTRDDGWSLAPASRAAALAVLERPEAALNDALRALGVLYLGREAAVARSYHGALRPRVEELDLSAEIEALAHHLDELVSLLEIDPPEDGYAEASWKSLGERVLDERHAIALMLRGCEALGVESAAKDPVTSKLAHVDGELAIELWRLTAVNEHRARQLEDVAPEHRKNTWWYSRGTHFPGSAVTHLGVVASLVACFPEARAELDAISEAEAVLSAVGSSPQAVVLPARKVEEPRGVGSEVVDAQDIEAPLLESLRRRKAWSRAGWLLSAAAILVTVLSGLSFKRSAEKADREKAALVAQAEAERAAADENARRLEEQLKLAATLSEAQKASLEQQLVQAKSAVPNVEAARARPAGASRAVKKASPSSSKLCTPGDPMCGAF